VIKADHCWLAALSEQQKGRTGAIEFLLLNSGAELIIAGSEDFRTHKEKGDQEKSLFYRGTPGLP
jgi:hypothetical protein